MYVETRGTSRVAVSFKALNGVYIILLHLPLDKCQSLEPHPPFLSTLIHLEKWIIDRHLDTQSS